MISLMVAMDRNRLIGAGNRLPWHLPDDLRHFKRVTMGHPIVMGRRTFESIGRPLPGRKNIVLSRRPDYQPVGAAVIHSPAELLASGLTATGESFVIGGAQVFAAFLPHADRIYLTCIDAVFAGDTYFPVLDTREWHAVAKKEGILDSKNIYPHTFAIYERN
ncbi:MAG: dihydrofolate reductase [Sporolactobacillus sp.]|jgi:dihydrofolate reductase|nr:dihydrofolate reductase [Sporolactobacillus sp.]MCI1883153.1 dihydrofolate reductase [Sporolactobacillus sp.]